ncbi:MAG: hypothetical protein AB7I04_13020 [Pseudomonadales bacterium]
MSVLTELKRRRVLRICGAYLAFGWLIAQVISTVGPALELPEWLLPASIWTVMIGFPVAVLLAWSFGARQSRVAAGVSELLARETPVAVPQPIKPSEPVLAVLPFDNLSNDPEMQFFSDGVSEEIIQRLTRGSRLKVIGRTSSFQFRGAQKSGVAALLRCTHVLDGSVRRGGGRVRIGAHLVEATSQTTLWSESYDGSLEDIFSVQDDISEQIAGALNRTFAITPAPVVDPAAYDLYLRASPESFAPDELRANVGLLEVATERAPEFIEAWGRLAFVRGWLGFYTPYAERAAVAADVAREVQRALEGDPDNLDAQLAKLFLLPPYGAFKEQEAILEQIRRTPGWSDRRIYVGWCLRASGRLRESAEETEACYQLDALNPASANLAALSRMASGRIAEAVPILEDIVARVPGMSFAIANLLRAHAFLGDWDAVDRLLASTPASTLREFTDGLPFIRTKRNPTAENIEAYRRTLIEQVARTGGADVSRLVYAAHLGLAEEAYQAIETARLGPLGSRDDLLGPDAYRTSLMFQPAMPELRNDPRFPRLCARLGLVEFWLDSDKWPDCIDEVPYDFRAGCLAARATPREPYGF